MKIEINLLPHEFRPKKEKQGAFDPRLFLYILGCAVGILLLLHVSFLGVGLVVGIQHTSLAAQWQMMAPQRKELDALMKQYDALSQDARISQQLVSRRVRWSQKLYLLSSHLTRGVWFEELSFKDKGFSLRGSVISLEHEEIPLINTFIDALKGDPAFYKDFATLEATSFQTRSVGGYDTVEYALSGTLK